MQKIIVLNNKIRENALLIKDLTDINVLDDIITESMINSEGTIKTLNLLTLGLHS